jgi:hypothetical protein
MKYVITSLLSALIVALLFVLPLKGASTPAEQKVEIPQGAVQAQGTLQQAQQPMQPIAPMGQTMPGQGTAIPGQPLPNAQTGQMQMGGTTTGNGMTGGMGCPMMGGMTGGMTGGMGTMGGGMGMMGNSTMGMTHNMNQGPTMNDLMQAMTVQDILQVLTEITRLQERIIGDTKKSGNEAILKELVLVREKIQKLGSEYKGLVTGQARIE